MTKKKVIEEQLEKDVKKDLEEVDEDEVKDALEEVEEEGAGEAAGTRYLATLKLLKQQQLEVLEVEVLKELKEGQKQQNCSADVSTLLKTWQKPRGGGLRRSSS